jgi:hypothetical protein
MTTLNTLPNRALTNLVGNAALHLEHGESIGYICEEIRVDLIGRAFNPDELDWAIGNILRQAKAHLN